MRHPPDPHRGTAPTPWVLLVEDNPGDVRLVQETLATSPVPPRVDVASHGDAALRRLRGPGTFGRRPDLVLLDLDLPGRSGLEVLRTVKSDPVLRTVPVCVLTSSSAAADRQAAYEGQANAYVVKPLELDAFVEVVRAIARFWLRVAAMPPDSPPLVAPER